MPSILHPARLSLPILALSLVSACVAPRPVAAPPLKPAPAPTPATPSTASTDWRDIPLTPGDWKYGPGANGETTARFGRTDVAPDFAIRCDRTTRTVTLARTTGNTAPATMAITTSAGNRTLATATATGSLVATLPANDGFLDRMVFSRGRFIVAVTGTPRLVIPAWPEFARVIEDCRG